MARRLSYIAVEGPQDVEFIGRINDFRVFLSDLLNEPVRQLRM
jgi:hypothetical protein